MAYPGGSDLIYKIFGLDHMGGEVFADAFSAQIRIILTSLSKIDRELNSGKRYDYMVSNLSVLSSDSSPTAQSAEIQFREKESTKKRAKASPCSKLVSVGTKVGSAQSISPLSPADEIALNAFEKLSNKAEKRFNYATMRNGNSDLVRVDSFLNRQVEEIVRSAQNEAEKASEKFFVGSANGSFDGVIEAADLAGDAPSARLILSAGGKPIESVLFDMDLKEVRMALGSRVRASGRAVYGSQSALPIRIEIRSIERIDQSTISHLSGSMPDFPFDCWTEET